MTPPAGAISATDLLPRRAALDPDAVQGDLPGTRPRARERAARGRRSWWRRRTARSWTSPSPACSHAAAHPLHGQAGAVREAVPRLVVHRTGRLPGRAWTAPTATRSRARTGSARGRRAGGDLPGGHAAARSRDRRALRRRAPTSRPRLGVPIVPVGIGGSEEILRSGKTLPRLHKVAIVVGEPDPAARSRRRRRPASGGHRRHREGSRGAADVLRRGARRSPACRTTRPRRAQRARSASTSDASIAAVVGERPAAAAGVHRIAAEHERGQPRRARAPARAARAAAGSTRPRR